MGRLVGHAEHNVTGRVLAVSAGILAQTVPFRARWVLKIIRVYDALLHLILNCTADEEQENTSTQPTATKVPSGKNRLSIVKAALLFVNLPNCCTMYTIIVTPIAPLPMALPMSTRRLRQNKRAATTPNAVGNIT